MAKISINGRSFVGDNVCIVNGDIIIDGVTQKCDDKEITINVTGDVASIECERGSIHVTGSAGAVGSISGSIQVGKCDGPVSSVSGSISIKEGIPASATTVSGNIHR